MKKHSLFALVALILVLALTVSACGFRSVKAEASATAAPTAEAAATATAEAAPSASPEAAETATPAPSATPTPSPTPTPTPTPEPVKINPLSGEVTDKDYSMARPVAVMVENNHEYGMINQGGISQAEIIVEFQVEQITRNMAIFMDVSEVPAIYPIRSARSYFASTAMAFDAIYVHRGESADGVEYASTVLQYYTDNDNIDLGNDNSYRMEVWPHIGVHGLATSGELLTNTFAALGTRTEHTAENFDYGLHFTENAAPTDGTEAKNVSICFPGNKMTYLSYDESLQGYTGYQWDTVYVDNNNSETIVFQNVLVLSSPTTIGADGHYHSVITTTDYTGEGFFFNGGYCEKITWSRAGLDSPYRFYTEDGSELELGVGHTYMAFVSSTYGGAAIQ